jgi:hypothetical protein
VNSAKTLDPRVASERGTGTSTSTSTSTVRAAMISAPQTCPATATVAELREVFGNDHVHCVLIVEGAVLLAVIERSDIVGAASAVPAVSLGRLSGRTVRPNADVEGARLSMLDQRRRRLAVVDDRGRLLGLLCLKRTGQGFCTDAGVAARAAERAGHRVAARTPETATRQVGNAPRTTGTSPRVSCA